MTKSKQLKNTKKPKVGKALYWTPRIISILFLLFLTIFSFDVIQPGLSIWQILVGLFMHNIPVFILAIIVWIAWKHELVGAIGFCIGGLLYIGTMLRRALTNPFGGYMLSYSFIIAGPAFIVAYLFYLNWKRKSKGKKSRRG